MPVAPFPRFPITPALSSQAHASSEVSEFGVVVGLCFVGKSGPRRPSPFPAVRLPLSTSANRTKALVFLAGQRGKRGSQSWRPPRRDTPCAAEFLPHQPCAAMHFSDGLSHARNTAALVAFWKLLPPSSQQILLRVSCNFSRWRGCELPAASRPTPTNRAAARNGAPQRLPTAPPPGVSSHSLPHRVRIIAANPACASQGSPSRSSCLSSRTPVAPP